MPGGRFRSNLKICTKIKSDSTSLEIVENDLKARKWGSIWTSKVDFAHVADRHKFKGLYASYSLILIKNRSTTLIQQGANHGYRVAILQHRIFMKKAYIVYLVGSVRCRVLWAGQTPRNLYWALYQTQLMRLREHSTKNAHTATRNDKIIFLFGNIRPHIPTLVKAYFKTVQTVQPHLQYCSCYDGCHLAYLSNTSHHMKHL